MASFCIDDFTDTSGTDLDAHNADTPVAVWARQAVVASNPAVISDANRARQAAAGAFEIAIYLSPGTPASADYDVTAPLFYVGTFIDEHIAGVCGRLHATDVTYYTVWYELQPAGSLARWELVKFVEGVKTVLDTFDQALSTSTTYIVKLEMRGTALKGYIDGVERLSATDGAITAANSAGLAWYSDRADACTNTSGYHFTDFDAADPTGESFLVAFVQGWN